MIWTRSNWTEIKVRTLSDLVLAEPLTHDHPNNCVDDVGCTEENLQETGYTHQTEQNHIPLDHIPGFQTHSRPQTVVIQVPWKRSDTREQSGMYVWKMFMFVCALLIWNGLKWDTPGQTRGGIIEAEWTLRETTEADHRAACSSQEA